MTASEKPVLPQEDDANRVVERQLRQLAQRFDAALRDRVSRLLFAAAEAILKLADIDLVRHEADEERGGHTLALWEELAPVTGSTVQHVNELIANATDQFPPPPEKDVVDNLDEAFGPDQGTAPEQTAPRTTEEEIAHLVAAVCS